LVLHWFCIGSAFKLVPHSSWNAAVSAAADGSVRLTRKCDSDLNLGTS